MKATADVDTATRDAALAARGDRGAFERLYRATAARVHSLARRLVGERDADDATQDAYVQAWRRLASFRGESSFSTWLHRLALNLFLSRLRGAPFEREESLAALEESARFAPAAKATDRGATLDLEDAIARLPVGARRVFVLHDVEGHEHAEIASFLGVSIGTSKSQLHRARLLLRDALDPRSEGKRP